MQMQIPAGSTSLASQAMRSTAATRARAAKDEQGRVFGTFLIDETEFALSVDALKEVVKEPESFTRILPSPDYFLGVFNLRGLVVPVIDLRLLLGLSSHPEERSDRQVAIIEHEGYCVGLMVDVTGDVFTARLSDYYPFSHANPETARSIISSVFIRDQGRRIVQVIDHGELLRLENVPRVESSAASTKTRARIGKRNQCLSFSVDDSLCAIDLSCIKEIVDFQGIDNTVMASGWTLGTIDLRGTTVPVIDLQAFLGGKNARSADDRVGHRYKLIVLKSGSDLLSFLVDAIQTILPYHDEDVALVPSVGLRRGDLIQGCLTPNENAMVMLLDHQKVFADKEITVITSGCGELFRAGEAKTRAHEQQRANKRTYITFFIGSEFALDISAVNEVMNFPEDITRPPNTPKYMEGVLSLRGDMIPIINPRNLYGLSPIELRSSRLLIFTSGNAKYGMMVDSVGAIVNATYKESRTIKPLRDRLDNAHLRNDVLEILTVDDDPTQQRMLIILNLDAVLSRCTA